MTCEFENASISRSFPTQAYSPPQVLGSIKHKRMASVSDTPCSNTSPSTSQGPEPMQQRDARGNASAEQLLSSCTPEQLQQLAKLPPSALQNLQSIVLQFVSNHHRTMQTTDPLMAEEQQGDTSTQPLSCRPETMGGSVSQPILASCSGVDNNMELPGSSMAMQVDKVQTPPSMNRKPLEMIAQGGNFDSPRFASLVSSLASPRSPVEPTAMEEDKEEIVLSPRSARMLLDAVHEGTSNALNKSSCKLNRGSLNNLKS